ncbi:MAG: class I SAM-dependent methyltransferase [Candidatus Hydrogenedentes bacterium]|nr:class I SAM-dependent methyltransferase [Candidatus Hydrogenedentota bacterium]
MRIPALSGCHSRYCFDGLAQTYDRWYETAQGIAHDRTQKSDVERFLSPRQAGACLLDIGCGTGHWSLFFKDLGYAVVGVDLSSRMVSRARSNATSPIAWGVADACALPFEDGSFDVVAAMATLEFLTDPMKTLHEMARCTSSGGRILIGTLNRRAVINRQRVADRREPYTSARLFSKGELRDLLSLFGQVRIVASDPDAVFPEGNWHQFDGFPVASPFEGPFLVAEVRR